MIEALKEVEKEEADLEDDTLIEYTVVSMNEVENDDDEPLS